jgi:hypothetical protein
LTLARQECPTADSNPAEFASACAAQPSWGLADLELVKRARSRRWTTAAPAPAGAGMEVSGTR